jgi:hypothetical protein
MPEAPKATVLKLADLVSYQEGSVVSRTSGPQVVPLSVERLV